MVSCLAAVVVFCTTYALILPAITLERAPVCGLEEHTHAEECYTAAEVLSCGLEESEEHIHTGDCYTTEYVLSCGLEEHTHTEGCYPEDAEPADAAGPDASESAVPPETDTEAAPGRYTYEDDSLTATVTLPEGTAVPADAVLRVTPITAEDEGYDYERLVWQAEEAVARTAGEIALYDISFYTPDEAYLPVSDAATVTLCFKEAALPEDAGELTVLHYQEDAALPVALEDVSVERDRDEALTGLTFQTEGFSVYAIMTADDTEPSAQADSSTFTLAYGGYTITFSVVDTAGKAIPGNYMSITGADATKYLFSDIAPTIEGYTYSGAKYGDFTVASVGTTGYNDNEYAFQLYMTEPIQNGKWYSRSENLAVTLMYSNDSINYSGNWAIVNLKSGSSTGAAMLADNLGESDDTNRAARTVTVVQSEGDYYAADASITAWTFEKQNDGAYYISTTVNGTTKYLSIGTAVTLSDTPQSITVVNGTGDYVGMVRLTANGRAVNLFSGSAEKGFGSYNDSSANEYQTLCKLADSSFLLYDLAVSTTAVGTHIISGSSWDETPGLTTVGGVPVTNPIQAVTAEGVTLYGPGTPGADGYFTFVESTRSDIREKLGDAGKEFRFDGWAATVDSETWAFPANATATLEEDGIHITDTGNVERVLPGGTALTAQWTQVSDIVLFFVNYTGTVLDTENDVSGRNQKDFTGIVGIGRVYFGAEQAGQDKVFGNKADQNIRLKFTNQFDPNTPATQVVMEYVTAYADTVASNPTASDPQNNGKGYDLYHEAPGINDSELEAALLQFIHDNSNVTIHVSTADNSANPAIENENSTVDNYSVRWYVMKEQADGWHIDGVMVAKTAEIAVTKTFSGLPEEQVRTLLNAGSADGFQMPVTLGTNRQPYITMTTQGIDGEYSYYGQEQTADGPGGQSYAWVLNAITDEQYTLSESNYAVDGYDVSAIVVHYYKDANGNAQVAYQFGNTTQGLPAEVKGGATTAVSFNNFYTKTGTGAFAVHKSSSNSTGESDVGAALQGAEFTLYSDVACSTIEATSTTNSRGSAYFSDLDAGTYYMKETTAPDGYLPNPNAVWKVVVENIGTTDAPHIKVTVYQFMNSAGSSVTDAEGTVCYDGGIVASYPIQNTPAAGTVRFTKTFSGLTALEMENIVQKSSEVDGGYYIMLQGNVSSSGQIDAGGTTSAALYLQDAIRSQDGFTFAWTVTNLAMESNDKPIPYTVTEYNYLHDGYGDTVITAAVNGEPVENDPEVLLIERNMASFKTTFHSDESDTVELTNHYTNTFTLTLQKVDGKTGEALPNAVFDVYGPYREASATAKRITYTDPDTEESKTAYYISTITADEKGIAAMDGLRLSGDSATFVYVINESFAPEGYVKSDKPIVQTVTVDADGYYNGVYTTDVPNTSEEDYNSTHYRLPETGGAGTAPLYTLGALLMLAAAGYGYRGRGRRPLR